MQNIKYYGIVLTLVLSASVFFPNAFALGHSNYNIIAVEYSQVCERAILNNITSDCPPLANLTKYDTSNKLISGNFVIKKKSP